MKLTRLLTALLGIVPLAARGGMTATFSATAIRVDGVTPHGSVAIVATLHEKSGPYMYARLNDAATVVSDDNGSGTVTFDLGHPISVRSLWALVDLGSGASIVVAPPGFEARAFAAPSNFIKKTADDDFDRFLGNRLLLTVVWVRPGPSGGAWIVQAADGGNADDDGKNDGKIDFSAASFRPVNHSDKPPKKLKTGDELIAIDRFDLSYAIVQVTK